MIPSPLLIVTDRHGSARPLVETVRAVLAGGATWIWLRDRDLEPGARWALAVELLAVIRAGGGRLTIGGDTELAARVGADGVHFGSTAIDPSLPRAVAAARSALGPNALVGVSAHGGTEIDAALAAGADYATLSPIFPSASKPGYGPALGLEGVSAASRTSLPILALGGIGPDSAGPCLAAGAAGIAVMGHVMGAKEPGRATRSLLSALNR